MSLHETWTLPLHYPLRDVRSTNVTVTGRNIRLWYALNRVFATIDIYPEGFTVVTHVTRRGVRAPCQHVLPTLSVAMARFGFHATTRGSFDEEWCPLGTPVRLKTSKRVRKL